jgi:chemotaxis protein histidine kinase CheA
MKRLLLACLVLVGIGLLILHQLGRLAELTPRLARLRAEVALTKITRLPAATTTDVVKSAPPAKSDRLEEMIRNAHKVMGGFPLLHPEDLFSDCPELETAFLRAEEGQLRIEFSGFFARAGLTPQQIDRYLEISMAGERDWIALTKEAAARGVTQSDPAIKLIGHETYLQRKREMEELLGPAGIALREQYNEERPARNALTAMAKASALGSHPITFDQLTRLTAVTTEAGVFDNDRPLQALGLVSGASGKAAQILTPEQQQHFELLIDARQAALLGALHLRRSQ